MTNLDSLKALGAKLGADMTNCRTNLDALKCISEAMGCEEDATTIASHINNITSVASGGPSAEELLNNTITEFSSDSLTTVKDYAFQNCSKLTSVNLPNATKIGEKSFYGCSSLSNANFPSVTTIGISAFQSVGLKLKKLDLPNVIAASSSAFKGNANLREINIPLLGACASQAFQNCGVKKLDLHVVTNIASSAFNACGIETLIIRTNTQMCTLANANAFTSTVIESGAGYIYVPSAMVDTYKAATNWSTYAAQIRAIEDYPDITGG